ncbi:(2Fe-2S)-binding protein [Paenibacillus protaetiae]|uniref:(2Fe-2S)-binding protein n=1 Tax=Paenibacillus protaetiae TaxID=2509456 RepID=A0A4P6EUC5_9BACL|nr:(2Fe-2S)-binding protein [Paenibacillus protaetiae]QAY66562.1 (2Fe-2S)-binding protein [Paenibacillus protaetiae]
METPFDFTIVRTYLHVSPEGADDPSFQMEAAQLLESAALEAALRESGNAVQALSHALPASFIGTSLCKLSLIQLWFAVQYDRFIDLSLEHLIYQVEIHGDHAHLGYKIKALHTEPIPAGDPEQFLADKWSAYFAGTVTPAVEAVAKGAGLKAEAIWQQFGGQLTILKNFAKQLVPREPMLHKLEQYSRVLSERLEPELFHVRRNPFRHIPRYVENPLNPEEKWMLQSSCCMYDRRENGSKCYTCPRMTPAEREERSKQLLAAAAVAP